MSSDSTAEYKSYLKARKKRNIKFNTDQAKCLKKGQFKDRGILALSFLHHESLSGRAQGGLPTRKKNLF